MTDNLYEKVIERLSEVYDIDGTLWQCFVRPGEDHGDALAKFVVRELKDVMDESKPDKENLQLMRAAMNRAAHELEELSDTLYDM